MKKSNLFLLILGVVLLSGMYATNVTLAKEYQKIDLTDLYKNYVSVPVAPYTVLDISGSNGYPIEIVQNHTEDIKVLRSRIQHFKSEVKNDTLFIQFTGSNIPMKQRYTSSTPPGIIIEKNAISSIINTNTHQRISGFTDQSLQLILNEQAFTEMHHCQLQTLNIDMRHQSQIDFSLKNTVDSLAMHMEHTAVARLQEIEFAAISHTLKDSVTFVLSKDAFDKILE